MERITMAEAIGGGKRNFTLEEYGFLRTKLDQDPCVGLGLGKEMKIKENGQRNFHLILEYLANHESATSMEIAEYDTKSHAYDKKKSTMRKYADNIKRFIEQHEDYQIFTPIENEIKSQDSGKRPLGRPSKRYRLSIFVILYVINWLWLVVFLVFIVVFSSVFYDV